MNIYYIGIFFEFCPEEQTFVCAVGKNPRKKHIITCIKFYVMSKNKFQYVKIKEISQNLLKI